MRFTTAIRTRSRNKWKRAAGAGFTVALLPTVVAAAFTQLSTDLLAAWKPPGEDGRALVSGGVFEGFLNFEAPAQTVSRVKTLTKEDEQSVRRAENASLLVKNWKYTQNPIADLVQLSLQALNQDVQILQADVNNYLTALAALINAVLTNYGNLVNAFAMSIANVSTQTNIINISTTSSNSHSASPYQ